MSEAGYLGLDLGGTGAKAGVFDSRGCMLGFGHEAFTPVTSSEGRSEISIDCIYSAAREAVRKAVKQAGVAVRALAVASQGQTFAPLDKDGHPLYAAIMWYDSRASAQAEEMSKTYASKSTSPAPRMESVATAPKVMWLREHYPDVVARAGKYLLLPDYISYRLTGRAVTDPCIASSTGLYVLGFPDYSEAALEAAGIERSQMADIQQTGTVIGKVLPKAAEEWGLSEDTIVVTGTNDQYAGALGAGNCRPGIVSETTGTCLALVSLVREFSGPIRPGLIVGPFPVASYQFVLAYSKTAGLLLEWFRSNFQPGSSLKELDESAALIPPGSRGLIVLPHFDGASYPMPNPAARGAICNLELHHTSADVYRAILESICFCLRENLEMMVEQGLKLEAVRSIGGGAKSSLWLQMKADVIGLPVERPAVTEAAAFGAAMAASVGAGDCPSLEQCSGELYRPGQVFQPNPENRTTYERSYDEYRRLSRALYPSGASS